MEVVIYKVKGKNGYLYDMSFNPGIDFEVLQSTREIKSLEVLTPKIPIEVGEKVLNKIYGNSLIKKIIGSHDLIIKRDFKKFSIEEVNIKIIEGKQLPSQEKINKVEDVIAGKVITLKKLCDLFKQQISEVEISEIVQTLYCQRRIRIIPATRKSKKNYICSFCEKPICNACCLGFEAEDVLLYAADNYNIGIPRTIQFISPQLDECLMTASQEITGFVKASKKNTAVVWSVPGAFNYNILSDAIADIVRAGGRILYITSQLIMKNVEREINSIFENLKTECIEKDGTTIRNKDLVICPYNNYTCFHKAFDLVIYDDRMAYVDIPLKNMFEISSRAVKENGKLINITSFPELKNGNKGNDSIEMIYIPVTHARAPIPEPLIVISRTFRDQIPEIAIDMVSWSIKDKLKTLIFVPTSELQQNIFHNLTTLGGIENKLIAFSTNEDKTALMKLIRKEVRVVISNDIKDVENVIEDMNIIVINADNPVYNRYILMHMATMAEVHNKKRCGQVMFIVEKENEEVSITKERIRGVNKIAWESGLIKK